MFKRDPNPVFKAVVDISQPGGESRPLSLNFRHKTSSQLEAFIAETAPRTDAEMLQAMVASVDADLKQPGETDADFLADVCEKYPTAKSDIFRTYLRELTQSRVKNF